MLGQVHEHIVKELGDGSRTDTIFVLTAIVFNLIVLAINFGVATEAAAEGDADTYDIILAVFIVMTVLLNIVAVAALVLGRRTRRLLLDGLVAMYRDNDVDKYYEPTLMSNYGVRYLLFAGVIATLAATAINSPSNHPLHLLNIVTLRETPGLGCVPGWVD